MIFRPSGMSKSLEREVHIWIASTEGNFDKSLLAWYKTILSEDEHSRLKKLYFKQHRKSFLLSHALLRTTLSIYGNVPPENWEFFYDSYGRPEIQKPADISGLYFNISRTQGLVVCLVSSFKNAGIDIENTSNVSGPELLFKHVLMPLEIDRLKGLSGDSLKKQFLIYWSLKESFVKATGKGLSLPLTQFSFKIYLNGCAQLFVDPQLSYVPNEWQFAYFWLTNEHVLAVAIRKPIKTDLKIKIHKVIPGQYCNKTVDN